MQAEIFSHLKKKKESHCFYAQGIVNFVPSVGVAGRLLIQLRKAVRGATK